MSAMWPRVQLGEILRERKPDTRVEPHLRYDFAGVYSFGRGVFRSQSRLGAEFSYPRLTRVRAGEFVYPKLMAWEGAFGVVPPECDDCVVSPEFPVFELAADRVDPAFLGYYFSRPEVLRQFADVGGTNVRRRRLYPEQLLQHTMPLPSLTNQRRIVRRIERVTGRLRQISELHAEVEQETERVLAALYHEIVDGTPRVPLNEVAPLVRRSIQVSLDGSYPELGVRSFGRGTFHKPPMQGAELTWQKPVSIRAGDIVISNIKAWEGAIAVARPEDEGRVGSHRYLTCVTDSSRALPEFVCFHLLTAEGLNAIGEASPGSADRNRTLSASQLQQIRVPAPSLAEQLRFVTLMSNIARVRVTRSGAARELTALVPSLLDRAFSGAL